MSSRATHEQEAAQSMSGAYPLQHEVIIHRGNLADPVTADRAGGAV
jgi:hypothetical protein